MHRLEADLKEFRGLSLIVSALRQRVQNHLPLNDIQRRTDRERNRVFGSIALALIERIWGKVVPLDLLA